VAAMAATAIVVFAPAAGAHPRLVSADPKPSTVAPGPLDHVTVHFDEAVQWQYSQIGAEDTKGHSLLAGKPQVGNREAVLPLAPGASGAVRVSWRLVGVDAHPVIGAYVFGISAGGAAAGAADLDTAIRRMAGSLGEGRIGSARLNWAIRGGRSLEIILLYLVLGLLLLSLASAAAIAFGFNTHANGLSPGPLWTAMMFGHLMLTAFWAGGLVALLIVVFPTGDPHRIWPAVSRYSNIMTVTLGLIVASGLVMLFRLLSGNIKGMWCSDFGVVAGFKMAVVGIAIVIGAINNRVVAYQKRSLEAPVNKFRPRKERSIGSLRRLIVIEAAFLGSAVLLSGALGETQLPSGSQGHF